MERIYIELSSRKAFTVPHSHRHHAVVQQSWTYLLPCQPTQTDSVVFSLFFFFLRARLSGKSHQIDSVLTTTGILFLSVCPCPTSWPPSSSCFCLPSAQSSPPSCASVPFSSLPPPPPRPLQEEWLGQKWPETSSFQNSRRPKSSCVLSYRNPESHYVALCAFILLFRKQFFRWKQNLWQGMKYSALSFLSVLCWPHLLVKSQLIFQTWENTDIRMISTNFFDRAKKDWDELSGTCIRTDAASHRFSRHQTWLQLKNKCRVSSAGCPGCCRVLRWWKRGE